MHSKSYSLSMKYPRNWFWTMAPNLWLVVVYLVWLLMASNIIKHLGSAHYHPATNGEAERFVQTFKYSLNIGRHYQETLIQKLL